jgi:hypothetical protein
VDRKRVILRVGFLALLAGGLVLWARLRMPRTMSVTIDLADALPGQIAEADVIVTRDGRLLTRIDRRFGAQGAPEKLPLEVRARPGPAQVEATLVYAGAPAMRANFAVELREEGSAVVTVKGARRGSP